MNEVLIDTNLLCLLVVGRLGREWIERHKRLRAYGRDDFDLLIEAVNRFSSIVVTPHTLAETSNLLRQTSEPLRGASGRSLAEVIAQTREENHPAITVVEHPDYLRLGLVDALLLMLARENCVLLSDDLDICLASASAGYPTLNFNYMRDGAYTIQDLLG